MMTLEEREELNEKWGYQRVEATMIFIERSVDHRGIAISIEVTKQRVETILRALVEDQ